MYLDALQLEMLGDRDLTFALAATGSPAGPARDAAVRALRSAPEIVAALLDDARVYAAVADQAAVLVQVSPYFLFSVLLRQARRELRRRSFTAEWLGPRRRVPVFDAPAVADVLADEPRVQYLADLLASFTAAYRRAADEPPAAGWPDAASPRGRFCELNLADLHDLLASAEGAVRFAVERRVADVALFLAGVFPDSARDAPEMGQWEQESQAHYRHAASSPDAQRCGLASVLASLAEELRPVRRALNFVTDRFLQPLRSEWFAVGA